MRGFRFFLLLAVGALQLGVAAADPAISMAGEGWTARKTAHGLLLLCDSAACGGEAGIIFHKQRVLANTEEELNKPYVNIRALINGGLLRVKDLGFRSFDMNDISKTVTADYTAIHINGTADKFPTRMLLIVQGGNAYLLASLAGTPGLADANLAKALKSADFRRKP